MHAPQLTVLWPGQLQAGLLPETEQGTHRIGCEEMGLSPNASHTDRVNVTTFDLSACHSLQDHQNGSH